MSHRLCLEPVEGMGQSVCSRPLGHEGPHRCSAVDIDAPPPPRERQTAARVHQEATDRYANIVKWRRTLEFQRPTEKERAIARIRMAGGAFVGPSGDQNHWSAAASVSAAEKLVEFDPDYAQFCTALTDVVAEEIKAKEYLLAARAAAGLDATEPVGGPGYQP